jgi:guanylate kinase
MVKEKKTGHVIVISGPSGAGKDTVVQKLLEQNKNIALSISMTTRAPRKGEEEGKDYYYVTKEKFLEEIDKGNFLEYANVYNTDYYGTPKDKVLKSINNGIDVVLVIDINGALQIKEKMPESIFIFIMPPSMKELKQRLVKRDTEVPEKLLNRFKTAYKEINEAKKYNYVVINDKVDNAVKRVESIIIAEKCRVDRIEDFDLNTEEELIHELLVEKGLTKA